MVTDARVIAGELGHTLALTQATLPFALALAQDGLESAVRADPRLMAGLQVHAGRATHSALSAPCRST